MSNPSSVSPGNWAARLYSVDLFRAVTMLLMIFVNDLWTLRDIPMWLEHAEANEDRLGFADTIFPAFLFIVGLSIPMAIGNRLSRGDRPAAIARYICLRALALVVMGFFHVNMEDYSSASFLPKPVWEILITIGFFLIWLDYPKGISSSRKQLLQRAGIGLLVTMALLYKGGSPDNPVWMRPQWWGILGLIGWAYLTTAFIYLALRERLLPHILVFILFLSYCAADKLGWTESISGITRYLWPIGDGATPALVMGGIVVSLIYRDLSRKGKWGPLWVAMGLVASLLFAFGFLSRPLWGIHKINASPSWVTICIGLSVLVYSILIWVVDVHGKKAWSHLIQPAGTSTLTCYLVPYLYYPVYSIIGISLPLILRTGFVGIVKSLLFALLIILITGFLEKKKIRLKL